MFDNLSAGNMVDMDDNELDLAMGVAPTKNKKPAATSKDDSDTGKKAPKNKQSGKDKTDPDTLKKAPLSNLSSGALDKAFKPDDDEDQQDDDNDQDNDEDLKNKKRKSASKKKDEDQDEEGSEDDDDEDQDEEGSEDDDNEEENDEDKDKDDEGVSTADFLRARVNLLLKKGEWSDWENRDEDQEWTEEEFADMELRQRQNQRDKMRGEILDSFGTYGREIAEFSEQGGDPDELIDIFKEQQKVEALSVDNEEQQRQVVFKFETEFLGKKPERVRKYIDSLVTDKELASEAKEAKEKMEEHWESQKTQLLESQKEQAEDNKKTFAANINKFASEVTTLVTAAKNIPEDEKKSIIKTLTKFDKKLPNGSAVNDFYFKFAEFKKSLPDYIDLVRFVLNKQQFIKSVKTQGKNEGVEKSFSLARQSSKNNKTKTSSDTGTRGKTSKKSAFKLMY